MKKGFTSYQLYHIWLLIEDLGGFLQDHIEAGAQGLEPIHKRKVRIQKMIQKKRGVISLRKSNPTNTN